MKPVVRARSVFYGWWIVSGGMMIQILVGGLVMQSFSSYVVVLREQFGWSKTMFSFGFAMTRVESGILGPAQGWAIDQLGPRVVTRVGIAIMSLGFVFFSLIQEPWHFFFAYFLIAVGSSLAGFMTLTVAVVNWFERRRAFALGILSTGFAIGGLGVPLVVLSFETFGWRKTALASGIITFVLGQIIATLFRHRPEDYGMSVDGRPPVTIAGSEGEPQREGESDFTTRQALRTPAFWYISLGHASALLVVSAVMVHLVLHVVDNLGYTKLEAGYLVALMTGLQVVGQLLGGYLGDRTNKRAIVVSCMLGHTLGMLLLAYATNIGMIVGFAVLHGIAWGARGPLMQAMRADYFGRRSFGTIMGFSSMIVMMGMMTGPIVAGVLADATGDYTLGFTILAILAGLGSVFFILATPPELPDEPAPVANPPAERAEALSPGG